MVRQGSWAQAVDTSISSRLRPSATPREFSRRLSPCARLQAACTPLGQESASIAESQSQGYAETMAITAGIAAASIIRHGIAAHTSSAAKLWRKAVEAAGARPV